MDATIYFQVVRDDDGTWGAEVDEYSGTMVVDIEGKKSNFDIAHIEYVWPEQTFAEVLWDNLPYYFEGITKE